LLRICFDQSLAADATYVVIAATPLSALDDRGYRTCSSPPVSSNCGGTSAADPAPRSPSARSFPASEPPDRSSVVIRPRA
jgi:hypothetical protein